MTDTVLPDDILAASSPQPEDVLELPLDERIGTVERLLWQDRGDLDRPSFLGILGLALIDRYSDGSARDDLEAAVDRLSEAHRTAPGHFQDDTWCWWLGCAFFELADLAPTPQDAVAEHDRAAAWFGVLAAGLDPDDPDLDLVAAQLADVAWARSWSLRYGVPVPRVEAAEDVRRLTERLDAVHTTGHHEVAALYVRALAGAAHFEAYGYATRRTERAHLDAGIDRAEPALRALLAARALDPAAVGEWVSDHRLALILGLLADGYRDRADLDDSRADLDLAVRTATDAVQVHRTAEPDAPTPTLLRMYLGQAHQDRWAVRSRAEEPDARTDLDAAIGLWQEDLADGWDGWTAGECADLLTDRAELDGSAPDARKAVDLLRRVVAEEPGNDPWVSLLMLARVERVASGVTGDARLLAAAAAHIDRALDMDGPDDDTVLLALVDRMLIRNTAGIDVQDPQDVAELRLLIERVHRSFDLAVRAGPDVRAQTAGVVGYLELFVVSHDVAALRNSRIRGLLSLADTVREAPPAWSAFIRSGFGLLEFYENLLDPRQSSSAGLGQFAKAVAIAPELLGDDIRAMLQMIMAGRPGVLDVRRAVRRGRRDRRPAGANPLPGNNPLLARPAPRFAPHDGTDFTAQFLRLVEPMAVGDTEQALEMARALKPWLDSTAPTWETQFMHRMVQMLLVAAEPTVGDLVELPPVRPEAGLLGQATQASSMIAAAALYAQGYARNDESAVRRSAEHSEAVLEVAHARDLRLALGSLLSAAAGRLWLARRAMDAAEARRAADLYDRAAQLAGTYQHRLWSPAVMGRAEALRIAGSGPRQARQLGIAALQGHAWQVFARSGTETAVIAAREAAGIARTVAGWCLDDRDADTSANPGAYADPDVDDELVAALDAGRALVLQATTDSRRIGDRLRAAGRADLAEEWATTGGLGRDLISGNPLATLAAMEADVLEVPDELRLKVLRVLGGAAALEPVTVAAIRDALTATGSDALVYLRAGDNGAAGVAVVVPASGRPVVRWLPALWIGEDTPVTRYAAAHTAVRSASAHTGARDTSAHTAVQDASAHTAARDASVHTVVRDASARRVAAPPDRDALGEVCAWAWSAAMRDVLEVAGGRAPGRPARLVLVPLAMLSLVPWHAARSDGPRPRHAVQDAVISYTPSARAFCASAGAATPTGPASTLIVGDPGGDLRFAGIEARAIHQEFYAAGTYFGRGGSGVTPAGTPQEVLAWIDAAPAGPLVLHFACHASIDPAAPADAHLVLAGGARLSAETLLQRARSAELDIEAVFLAACTTGATGDQHDEVLSLATSFLAAGARTAFCSLWPVPDGDTSVLMFMVHHYLRAEGCRPADALHRAQVWMLDPARVVPASLPEQLRRHCTPGSVFPAASWAGFTHLGR